MVKDVLIKIADFFGFRKSSKYVNNYLHRANMRSGIFMAAVVVILEIWLVIRQHNKYIIPNVQSGLNYFDQLFKNTSLFWLLMIMALAMLTYCLFYLSERKRSKIGFIIVLCVSAFGLILCSLLPFENRIQNYNPKRLVDTVLLICLYGSITIFHIVVIVSAILKYKGKNYEWLNNVTIITLFATICLIFGVKVSYSDFFSTSDVKQIICFLTMVIYVACLLIWKPYISVAVLGAVFLGFYFLLESNAEQRAIPDGDKVNYITFFISLAMISISIYAQRITEARKDEELEILATRDVLTGLYSFEYFKILCDKKINNENIKSNDYIYLFFDIVSFKTFNDQRGYFAGNEFLKNVGQIISSELPGSLVTRQSDDHFAALTPIKDYETKIEKIAEKIRDLDADIHPSVKIGGCILDGLTIDTQASIEKARYACAALKHRGGQLLYAQYDHSMHEKYTQVQYIVAKIDEAIEKDWIVAYYQPVVFSKDHTLCGVECLARWIDPKFGFLNPGIFIPALEDAQLAYKLDLKVLEIVCKNMRKVLDNNETIVPTSINFSRADFSIVDVPSEVFRITEKYHIPPKYLHIEITESALLEEHVDLKDAMRRMKEKGFSLWLDDFGSGYSSFNTLKDYDFDVIKLDMGFLKGFDSNKKARPLIKAVIDMANQVGMRTLCEGVETLEQANFLKEIRCERLQGYLFSKPINYEELNEGIAKGKFVISKNLD